MTMLKISAYTAVAILATPAIAQTTPADTAAQQAQQAARDNRHDDAIDGYRRAIDSAPDRRAEWLLRLADQLTWAQRPAEAIPLYREALASGHAAQTREAHIGLARALSWVGSHDESVTEYDRALALDPSALDVRLARAQVLLWANRLGDAQTAYDGIVRDHGDNADARRGRARVLSWRGRYRAAIADAQQLVDADANDVEARVILAESLIWMGRPDRARAVLEAHPPQNERVSTMVAELDRQQRPLLRFDLRDTDRSDDLAITEIASDASLSLDNGRGAVGVRLSRTHYSPNGDSTRAISVTRPQIYGSYRVSDALAVNAALAIDSIDATNGARDFAPLTYDAYATIMPNDVLRFDIGVSRWTFDSEETLLNRLSASQIAASVDIRPDDKTVFSARIRRASYADGNRQTWWQGEVSHRLLQSPNLVASYRYTGFDFTQPGQPGYYNPDAFHSHELALSGYGRITPRLYWSARIAGARESERGNAPRYAVSASASLTQQLSDQLDIEAAYDFSSSRTGLSGGFERGIARVTLKYRF